MTNKTWRGYGLGTKNKKGAYIEMYFAPENIAETSKVVVDPDDEIIKKFE